MVCGNEVGYSNSFIWSEEKMMREEWRSDLCGRTLELQQHHGAGTLHDVEVEQLWLVPVGQRKTKHTQNSAWRVLKQYLCVVLHLCFGCLASIRVMFEVVPGVVLFNPLANRFWPNTFLLMLFFVNSICWNNFNYTRKRYSLKWGASLSTELASTVGGIDHLSGVTLGPGWEPKNRKEKLTRGCGCFGAIFFYL